MTEGLELSVIMESKHRTGEWWNWSNSALFHYRDNTAGVRLDEDDANTRDHYTMDGAKEKSKQGNILIDR